MKKIWILFSLVFGGVSGGIPAGVGFTGLPSAGDEL